MPLRGVTKWPSLSPDCVYPGSETPHLGTCALNNIVVRGWKHHNNECMSKSSRCAESITITETKNHGKNVAPRIRSSFPVPHDQDVFTRGWKSTPCGMDGCLPHSYMDLCAQTCVPGERADDASLRGGWAGSGRNTISPKPRTSKHLMVFWSALGCWRVACPIGSSGRNSKQWKKKKWILLFLFFFWTP